MWPEYNDLKESFERWLDSNHPNYLKDLGTIEWANIFAGKHHSAVIIVN